MLSWPEWILRGEYICIFYLVEILLIKNNRMLLCILFLFSVSQVLIINIQYYQYHASGDNCWENGTPSCQWSKRSSRYASRVSVFFFVEWRHLAHDFKHYHVNFSHECLRKKLLIWGILDMRKLGQEIIYYTKRSYVRVRKYGPPCKNRIQQKVRERDSMAIQWWCEMKYTGERLD